MSRSSDKPTPIGRQTPHSWDDLGRFHDPPGNEEDGWDEDRWNVDDVSDNEDTRATASPGEVAPGALVNRHAAMGEAEAQPLQALIEIEQQGERSWVGIRWTPEGKIHTDHLDPKVAQRALKALGEGIRQWAHPMGADSENPPTSPEAQRVRRVPDPQDLRETRIAQGTEEGRPSSPERRSHRPVATTSSEQELVALLQELLLALGRAGVDHAQSSPTVQETLVRMREAMGKRPFLGVLRWVGRLQFTLDKKEARASAHLMAGAHRLLTDLEESPASAVARRRVASWLGAHREPGANLNERADGVVTHVHNRTWIEVAREWVDGWEPRQIERRYCVCVHTGEIFCEEGIRGDGSLSEGTCPRTISAGLTEVVDTAPPRRVRMLQYDLGAKTSPEALARLDDWCVTDTDRIRQQLARALEQYPGVGEPVALVRPAYVSPRGILFPGGPSTPLPFALDEESGTLQKMMELTQGRVVHWMACRLLGSSHAPVLRPLSLLLSGPEQPCTLFRLS